MAAYAIKPRWAKGVSGNPNGRPKTPEYLKHIRALNSAEVARLVAKYGRMTFGQLLIEIEKDSLPVIDKALAVMFRESIIEADHLKLNFLLDRSIGKVDVPLDDEDDDLSKMSVQELITTLRDKIPEVNKLLNAVPE